MEIKGSDYIVEFLINKEITDVFGYPGGMVTHLMDSFYKYREKIKAHLNYHEQGAAFAACGYAQVSNKPGVAYATSGPGATNLITGIANAYFDSIPTIFITGQVNTFEARTGNLRQKGFQETDILEIVRPIVKKAFYVSVAESLPQVLEEAYRTCMEGRRGPVVLDVPMDVQRTMIECVKFDDNSLKTNRKPLINDIQDIINNSKRPVLLLGNGMHSVNRDMINTFIKGMGIPVVTSMVAVDLIEKNNVLNYGFLGAYGSRIANFITAKADLIISLGSRLDIRQVGANTANFATNAKLIRFDEDITEFERKVKKDEIDIQCDIEDAMTYISRYKIKSSKIEEWIRVCDKIKETLIGSDDGTYNKVISNLSQTIDDGRVITTDVGQNQVWVAQSFMNKENQRILFSGGHGAMGYSLPAAIGAYYATKKPVVSFNGDGGIQMNIQELQFIAREKIPVKIIIMNNSSLGMIRHFQEMYFDSVYFQTVENDGYLNPDFSEIAKAYGIRYFEYKDNEFDAEIVNDNLPCIIEIKLSPNTHVFPKLAMGKMNQDQDPLLDREIYEMLMRL